ncbi:MAG TPA: hypothetical protein VGE26_09160 [Sphingobacteriaceae bacterium]
MPYILLSDVYSYCSRETKYASKYDRVQLITKNEHVVILEDRKGNRFPTSDHNLVEVTDAEYKIIATTRSAIDQLKEKTKTPANLKRMQVEEKKIKQLLNI